MEWIYVSRRDKGASAIHCENRPNSVTHPAPLEEVGHSQMSLQLPQTTSSFEVWCWNPYASNASRMQKIQLNYGFKLAWIHSWWRNHRTTCFARFEEFLEKQLDILRCHYNFLRPHRALKFGPETRTPAMQAGLAKRRLSFRDVFTFLFVITWMKQLDSRLKNELDFLGIAARIHTWWRKHPEPTTYPTPLKQVAWGLIIYSEAVLLGSTPPQ